MRVQPDLGADIKTHVGFVQKVPCLWFPIYIFSTGFISKRLTEGQLEDENNKVEVELFSF